MAFWRSAAGYAEGSNPSATAKVLSLLPQVKATFKLRPCPLAEECFRLEILECRRSLGEDVIGQTGFADSSRHCNGPDQRAEY